MDQGSQEVWKN